jgi:hypothetical protein
LIGDVINEVDERHGAISGTKGHDGVSPFDCIRPLKRQFFLTLKLDGKLVISGGSIKELKPAPVAKFDKYSRIALGNGVRNDSCDQVQQHVVHAEPPHEIVDVTDVFLVGLGGKNGLEEPSANLDLSNMAHFLKCQYGPAHDWNFFWSLVNLLRSNGRGIASTNDAFVVANQNKDAVLVKDRPVLDHKCVNLVTQCLVKMGQVELLEQPLAVLHLIVLKREEEIGRTIGIRWRMLQFTED